MSIFSTHGQPTARSLSSQDVIVISENPTVVMLSESYTRRRIFEKSPQ